MSHGTDHVSPHGVGLDAESSGAVPELTAQREALLGALPSDKLRELVGSIRPDAPLAWAMLFPKVEGFGTGGDVKRRVRMLQGIQDRLHMLLFPGEVVEFVTTGILNSYVEQYFLGVWAYQLNRMLFVFTSMRVLLISCDAKGKAKAMMWQIPYERLQKYGAGTFTGAVSLKTLGGKTYTFVGVPGGDRKRLKEYMAARLAQTQAVGNPFPSFADRDPLCVACASPIPERAPACPECGDALVNPTKPALMSLLLPGLGHMYLGHRAVALIEMGFFVILVGNAVLAAVRTGPLTLAFFVPVIVIANTVDCLITLHMAKKGAFPVRLAWSGG